MSFRNEARFLLDIILFFFANIQVINYAQGSMYRCNDDPYRREGLTVFERARFHGLSYRVFASFSRR